RDKAVQCFGPTTKVRLSGLCPSIWACIGLVAIPALMSAFPITSRSEVRLAPDVNDNPDGVIVIIPEDDATSNPADLSIVNRRWARLAVSGSPTNVIRISFLPFRDFSSA